MVDINYRIVAQFSNVNTKNNEIRSFNNTVI